MKELFYHRGPVGTHFFGIRLSGWNFFTILSISFFDVDIMNGYRKFFRIKIGLFFDNLILPTSKIRYEAMRRY